MHTSITHIYRDTVTGDVTNKINPLVLFNTKQYVWTSFSMGKCPGRMKGKMWSQCLGRETPLLVRRSAQLAYLYWPRLPQPRGQVDFAKVLKVPLRVLMPVNLCTSCNQFQKSPASVDHFLLERTMGHSSESVMTWQRRIPFQDNHVAADFSGASHTVVSKDIFFTTPLQCESTDVGSQSILSASNGLLWSKIEKYQASSFHTHKKTS